MNTPEVSIEEQVEAYREFRRGGTIQFWSPGFDWTDTAPDMSLSIKHIIRRKPAPKMRAFRLEEVMPGWCFREKGSANYFMVTARDGKEIFLGRIGQTWDCYCMPDTHEVSKDFGKTWEPAGVLSS